MTYEVELKFPLAESDSVCRRLSQMGAVPAAPLAQRDLYFSHPQRQFEQTDEALRIRCVGNQSWITYKGPVVDSRTKSRRELEIEFEEGAADKLATVLEILGFRQVRSVCKLRTPYHLQWEGRSCEAALDDVEGLGTFLEIETLAEEAERDNARDTILTLARHLGLEGAERRSYLSMLLEKDVPPAPLRKNESDPS
jgi:adenylate cyclase class 2